VSAPSSTLCRVAFDSHRQDFRSSPGVGVFQALPATGPGGRGGPSRAEGHRGEEGRGEGPSSLADAGSARLGEAPSEVGEGRAPEGAVTGDA
jgi:hypothetical protein